MDLWQTTDVAMKVDVTPMAYDLQREWVSKPVGKEISAPISVLNFLTDQFSYQ